MTGIIAALLYGVICFFAGRKIAGEKPEVRFQKTVFWCLLAAGLLFRVVLGLFTVGYENDLNTFKAWGMIVRNQGMGNVYYNDSLFLDYPPGYLYILTALDGLRSALGIGSDTALYTLMVKLPSILADLGCGGMLYALAATRTGRRLALFFMTVYLFCPAVWINSAVWGQADGFCLLIVLLSLWLLLREKYPLGGLVYGFALLLKPQMLLLAPVFLFFVGKKRCWRALWQGMGCAVLSLLLLSAPFTRNFDYRTLLGQYLETMGSYPYFSLNACNLYTLLGMNWTALSTLPAWGQTVLTYGPMVLLAVGGWWIYRRAQQEGALFAVGALILAGFYQFTVMMHERYLFPALLLLLLAAVTAMDRRLFGTFLGTAGVHAANLIYVLENQTTFPDAWDPVLLVFSFLQLLLFLLQVYQTVDIFVRGHTVPLKSPQKESPPAQGWLPGLLPGREEEARMKRHDWGLMLAVTGLYACVAFWCLGSREMPVSCWAPQEGETVVLQLTCPARTMRYLPGLVVDTPGERSRTGMDGSLSVSVDGLVWSEGYTPEGDSLYTWQDLSYDGDFSYVKITANTRNLVISELCFFDAQGEPVSYTIQYGGEGAQALCDEAKWVPDSPTWYDSMYFDEVYHARTAYEHLLGAEPYENTHPTLGKLLIAAGIALFGMNPFGWRFMGALFGVAMLPLFYHMTKKLTRSSLGAFLAVFLFAFDFMHFTQTRIATIDTYAVFFTLLMFDGMLCFWQRDLLHTPLLRLLRPLAVSGVGLGLGVAAKWNTAYGAVGLLVLFLWHVASSYRSLTQAWQRVWMQRRLCKILLACCVFFLLVPAALYGAAFLPVLCLPGHSLGDFWGYQVTMFSYHSGLQATHAFSSSWWEWPVMTRPVWYHVTRAPAGQAGTLCTIAAMGSPLLWWGGLPAMGYAVWAAVRDRDRRARFLLVGFGSCYLPWMLISRLTFLYHYFPCVPFLAMAMGLWVQRVFEQPGKRGCRLVFPSLSSRNVTGWRRLCQRWTVGHMVTAGLCVLSLGFFLLFWPVLSGSCADESYIRWLQWLPGWYFGA